MHHVIFLGGEGAKFNCIFNGRNEVVAKVIFLHLFVILFTGGGVLPQCMLGYPPGTRQTPSDQTPPPPPDQTPPPTPRSDTLPQDQADPPDQTPPWDQADPLDQTPPPTTRQTPLPGSDTPPPREADCSRRSTSGRYASYWNAFL